MTCPLCDNRPELAGLTIFEDSNCVIRLETSPLARGHAVAILRAHRLDITDANLTAAEHGGLLDAIQRVAGAMKSVLGCERVYVATMSDVVQHLHYHLVPRYPGDVKGFPFWAVKGQTAQTLNGTPTMQPEELAALAATLRARLF